MAKLNTYDCLRPPQQRIFGDPKAAIPPPDERTPDPMTAEAATGDVDVEDAEEIVLEGTLVCALTGEHKTATPQEETLQSFIEQLHREYSIDLGDMGRDVRVECAVGEEGGKQKKKTRTVQLVVYEHGKPREVQFIIRAVVIAKLGAKPDQKTIALLEEVLGGIAPDADRVFGLWTNGVELTFRMREYSKRTGHPVFTELTDFPAPHETLEDLESAERRPMRVAAGDSLLRTFKRCHDYLYGNQNRRDAFWQLLYLIFAKILDEQTSSREFFVGATERNTEAGEKRIAARIKKLFDRAKETFGDGDVFEGDEKIELRDRALAYVAAEISRYSLLSTDTDAKGMAYEAITSTTMKRERGQFFTPRNIIRMMVEMVDPPPGKKVLDPACGSGGFLVVVLTHVRKSFLRESGYSHLEQPMPKELKRVDPKVRDYARKCLWGLDVDPDLRKAARMNMVMNNDGHGNIFEANSLELVAAEHPDASPRARQFLTDDMKTFLRRSGGLGSFDYVFTNPPFGAKIPVEDPDILRAFDLGHTWKKSGDTWTKGEPQKKVAPEILFIEACFRFLVPGTGVMAVVLPNGPLGNPGEQMEFVRWWMLRHTELLASVDLPGEAFLPQVSVQASCVFLRRRTDDERRLAGKGGVKQRPVFMAIAEACGHGRRGEVTWVRNPDGSELVEDVNVVERWERDGSIHTSQRRKQVKRLADDLPWIATEFHRLQTEATK
jgi:type I restriction enzyme M protein